jgi:hypothetical protein
MSKRDKFGMFEKKIGNRTNIQGVFTFLFLLNSQYLAAKKILIIKVEVKFLLWCEK